MTLPPRFAERALREARRMCRVRTRPVAKEKLRDPEAQLDLVELWSDVVEEMLHQPPPILNNTDGDPIQFTSDDFSLAASREEVARRLSSVDASCCPGPVSPWRPTPRAAPSRPASGTSRTLWRNSASFAKST